MRLACYNCENLFERARILSLESDDDESRWSMARAVLDAFGQLNALLRKKIYSDADKLMIAGLLTDLGLAPDDDAEFVILRRNRGQLVRRTAGQMTVIANGRDDWIGWIELKTGPVSEIATQMTARVIRDVAADALLVVEVDNRPSLKRFNAQLLPAVEGVPYDRVMLIDGNDERGIDVGLMTRAAIEIETLRSHVDDRNEVGAIFSRDCPEFQVRLPSGDRLLLLGNHFKSKGGNQATSNALRLAQATRTRAIYEERRAAGHTYIAILGDLNDTPDSAPLAPLLQQGSNLKDLSLHPAFVSDGRVGTFGNGNRGDKIDYILLSPALFARVTGGAYFRRGVWGGRNGDLFPHYPEMLRDEHAASDHAAVWVDLDL